MDSFCTKTPSRLISIALFFFITGFIISFQCFSEDHLSTPCFIITKTISITALPSSEKGISGEPLSVTIPLKRIGHLFLIEVKIDNEVGDFVFDSGSAKLVLNRTYFRKYMMINADEGGGVTGSTRGFGQTKVRKLQISGLTFENSMADVLDLGHIENRRGVKILGLFGFSLIKNLELVIDLNHNELHLYRVDKNGNRLDLREKRQKPDVMEKISEYHNILFVKAKIGGKVLNFCLDTGAESNVLDSFSPKKVLSAVTIQRRSELTGSGSQGAEVLYGTINDFMFAEKKMTNMQTIITSLQNMSDSYGVAIDGMLGYDFFSQGEICINLAKNEMGIRFAKTEK